MSETCGEKGNPNTISRRVFIQEVGTGVVTASTLGGGLIPSNETATQAAESPKILGPGLIPIVLKINGKTYETPAEPRETLLEVLRNRLEITGPKMICDSGTCGGCTVYVQGKTVYSCMMLAVEAQGKEITTIEGLASGDQLHPVQEAFVEADAIQCGFCTPGFVMSMAAVFRQNPSASLDAVKTGIAGHICRCGTYAQMYRAAELARVKMGG